MGEYPVIRSALFVPGNRPDRVDKAVRSDADAVVIDLEDSVPPDDKIKARETAQNSLSKYQDRLLIVRVNSVDSHWLQEDLEAIINERLKAIVFPKANDPEEIKWLDQTLCSLEEKRDLQPGQVKVFPLIESAKGVRDMDGILNSNIKQRRLWTAFLGAADYTADMAMDMTDGARELEYVRARLGIACRAANLEPPIDSPYMVDIKDVEACEKDAARARTFGFQGKQCIHPLQVEPVNRIFSPTEKQIKEAVRIIDAYREALDSDRAALQLDGKFIDPPIFKRAQKTLKLAEKINADSSV